MWLFLMLLGASLEVVGDVAFKKWGQSSKTWFAWAGMLSYSAGSIAWMYALKNRDLGRTVVVFMMVNALLAVFLGVLLFDEKLTMGHKIGLVFALTALYLLENGA